MTISSQAGALVRKHRKSAGLTAAGLAVLAGLSHASRVIKIEHGRGATLENLAAIARALKISLRELVP